MNKSHQLLLTPLRECKRELEVNRFGEGRFTTPESNIYPQQGYSTILRE